MTTKVRVKPIKIDDIKEYLATQDDFALELYVYNKARTHGLKATHSGTYEDPITKKTRQYDVRVWTKSLNRRIDLAIECKSLRTCYPLLISRIRRISEESYHQVIYSRENSTSFDLSPPAESIILNETSLYQQGEYVGKSTSQIGRTEKGDLISGDTEVFDKWSQAFLSADQLIRDAVYYCQEYKQDFFTAVLPILVVSDNTLWIADYTDEGVLENDPKMVDEALLYIGRVYFKPSGISFQISHLHIFTKTGITAFLAKLAEDLPGIWTILFPLNEINRKLGRP